MLWSIGKDSTVLLWLARKAFFGHVPFPLVHIDTSYKLPEMIAYRDRLAHGVQAADGRRPEQGGAGREGHLPRQAQGEPEHDAPRSRPSRARLLRPAQERRADGDAARHGHAHAPEPRDRQVRARSPTRSRTPASSSGARADEEGSRSKERYFSPRDKNNDWDVGDQPPEFWNQFKTDFAPGHARAHPPAARLDRAQHLGVHQAREHPDGVALLRPGRRHALPQPRLRSLPGADQEHVEERRRHHRRAQERQAAGTSPSARAACRTASTASKSCAARGTCDRPSRTRARDRMRAVADSDSATR